MLRIQSDKGLVSIDINGDTAEILAELTLSVRTICKAVFEDYSRAGADDDFFHEAEAKLNVSLMAAVRKGIKEARIRHEAAENPV